MLFSGLEEAAKDAGVPVTVNRIGSMGALFFSTHKVIDFASAKACDQRAFIEFYKGMMGQGIYLAPSPFEAMFVSTAHSEEMIHKTIDCATAAIGALQTKFY